MNDLPHVTSPLELEDIQGIVLRGYELLDFATFALLTILPDDAGRARAWLRSFEVRNALVFNRKARPGDEEKICRNVAFTYEGITLLLPRHASVAGFSRPFMEGMVTEHRRRVLGDFGADDPDGWEWGYRDKAHIHIVLLLYATSEKGLEDEYELLVGNKEQQQRNGLKLIRRLDTKKLKDQKEHFGFRDGIGQPTPAGKTGYATAEQAEKERRHPNAILPGEFVLGYLNEYKEMPLSPTLERGEDPTYRLPEHPETGAPDLGRNGSYLVMRQLEQDVRGFWQFCAERASLAPSSTKDDDMVTIAAKTVGRWPSGAPLIRTPRHDIPDDPHLTTHDDFYYAETDPDGVRVPIGSHIRRANPRDSLLADRAQSSMIVKHHRMIRRGRAYGEPLDDSMEPHALLTAPDNEKTRKPRGLHFLCFNSDIARQFEFVQQMWLDSGKFHGLREDVPADGATSASDQPGQPPTNVLTVPDTPVRAKLPSFSTYITVKGGGYFFMPGIKAINYLSGKSTSTFTRDATAVFNGGGVKAIAFTGALEEAEKAGIRWHGYAGTSGGAIVATLLAVGYDSREIYDYMCGRMPPMNDAETGKPLPTVFDPAMIARPNALFRVPVISPLINAIAHMGAFNADLLESTMERMLLGKGVKTWADLRCTDEEKEQLNTDYRLQLIATDLTNRRAVILPQDLRRYDLDPDQQSVARSVRMSMGIPGFFEPVVLKNTSPETVIVDGMLVSSFPIWVFQQDSSSKWPTLGFFLNEGASKPHRIRGLGSLAWNAMSTGWSALDRILAERYAEGRTLSIDVQGFPTINRSMSDHEREKLRMRGVEEAASFFAKLGAVPAEGGPT